MESPPQSLPEAGRSRELRFADFVASHRARAVRLAWRLVGGDDAAAEDVAQDAFVRAWRALPRFREDAQLSTWVYRILVRRAADHRRWRGVRDRWSGTADPETAPAREAGPGDPGLRARIGQAMERLSRRQRECFVLVHLEGFTITEAAEFLGKPPGTVKSHLHRALAKLRDELGDLRKADAGARS